MDRNIVYPGQIPLETDMLNTNRNTLVGLSMLAQDLFGTGTVASGFTCVPTAPASMQVQVTPGRLYMMANLDGTAYSSLAADTTHQMLKQGILMDAVNLSCPAPATAGYSINYLIQATYQDLDSGSVVLPYYNASNPSVGWSGPANSGASQPTVRRGAVTLSAKAGTPATTGTQATPAPDSGYVGLFVVTVANGAGSIVSGAISQYASAPFLFTLADLASPAAGKNAELMAYDPALNYTLGTLGWAEQRVLSVNQSLTGIDTTGVAYSSSSIRTMIALAKSLGVGKLRFGRGTYNCQDIASEAGCFKIDFPLHIDCESGTYFQFSYWRLPLFCFVGSNGGRLTGADLVFTGSRGASPSGANFFGFDGTGALSPPDWACYVAVVGSSNVVIDDCRLYSTSGAKEGGVLVFGGNSTGPNIGSGGTAAVPGSGAVYSTGNKVTRCRIDDAYFHIAGGMQLDWTVDQITFGRYYADGYTGAGHALYVTAASKGKFTNLRDLSDYQQTPGSGTYKAACSFNFRSASDSIIGPLWSKRPEGVLGFVGSNNENRVMFKWSGARYAFEAGLASVGVLGIALADSDSTFSGNEIRGVIQDIKDGGASRSANLPIMTRGGASYDATRSDRNVFSLQVASAPDAAHGQSIVEFWGTNTDADVTWINTGSSGSKTAVALLGDDPARPIGGCNVKLRLSGTNRQAKVGVTNSAGTNVFVVEGATGTTDNSSALASGDKVVYPADYAAAVSYTASWTPVAQGPVVRSMFLTGNLTVNAPTNPYTGQELEFVFTQDGTGGRTITWNAVFKKAADGAGAAGQKGRTRFRYDGANWIQSGGALAWS